MSQVPLYLTKPDILLRLLSVVLLIAINAFFVTAEFSMVSVRRSRINQLVAEGEVRARAVQALQRNVDRLLSATQLGITLSSLALGWIGESTMAVLISYLMLRLPLPAEFAYAIAHSLAIPTAFLAIAYLQIVLGELCPKSLALMYSENLALFLGAPSLAIARFFNPFIWVLNQSTRFLLKLFGIEFTGMPYTRVTPEELQMIIATERESSGLEAEQRELLNNVFEFGDAVAGEVMIPRTKIAAIPITANFQMLLEEIAASGYSRYPMIGESLDDVRGIIDFKQLAAPLAQGQINVDSLVHPWMRSPQFVPEFTALRELLPMMQRSPQAIAIVVDEFGGTAGLITLKDLIAQITGDNLKLDSANELPVQFIDAQTFIVQAQINLEDANDLLGLDLPLHEEYQTLGGFLLYQYQRIPAQGETLNFNNLELTVISASGSRLHEIRIYRPEPELESPNIDGFEDLEAEPMPGDRKENMEGDRPN